MKKYFYLLLFILATSCYKDKTKPPGDCDVIVSYSVDIKPIINTSCVTNQGPGTGCHDAWIFNYDNILGFLGSGIWKNEVIDLKTMPQIPNDFGIDSLTNDELKTMRCWIEQGYPEN